MATTVEIEKIFESDVKVEYVVNVADSTGGASEQLLIDVSALTGPDGVTTNFWRPVLLEASWNMHPDFDSALLAYHDEDNDEVILRMTGDGYDSRVFSGGGTIDVEGADSESWHQGDFDVRFDISEDDEGSENANATASFHFIFKKRGDGGVVSDVE